MPSLFQPGYLPAQTLAGKVFIGSTTYAGVAIPAYSATAQVFGLWNPQGSGVNVILISLDLAIATAGTEALGALGFSYLANTGASIASGGPVSAFTQTASVPALIGAYAGGSAPSAARFTLSATITTPTFYRALGITETAGSATTTAAPLSAFPLSYQFSGADGVAPGTYIGLGGSAAPGSTYQATLVWMELPISGS